jgi:DNA polymerase I-like protein with 3'-5' exonuclease and polymerase domains
MPRPTTILDSPHQLPLLTPDSDWVRPRELPDLRNRKFLAIDTENRDDGLATGRGPGWPYRAGYVCGVGWAAEDSVGYAPIAHPDSDCFDKEQVAQWLKDHVKAGVRLVFQNAPYDLGWLHSDLGVDVAPEHPIEDALCAAFMLNEDEYEYSLDSICERLGIPGKDETMLREAAASYLRPPNAGKKWKPSNKDIKSNMHRLPARYVGIYGETDPLRTLQAFHLMKPTLEAEGVDAAYRLEMDIVPVIRRMRTRGIKVDVEYAIQQQSAFRGKRDEMLREIQRRLPGRVPGGGGLEMEHLRSPRWLDPIMHDEGIRVPRTEATSRHVDGQSSYKQDWMEVHPHWLPKMVAKALQYERFAEVFLGEYVLGFVHRGRIHAEIHQYKSNDGGTVSYRFAYSGPPLQQAPSPDMDPELGVPFRRCFVADGVWGANDYSQQEYRLTAHFAAVTRVRGGAHACQQFIDDPDLDFHQMVSNLTGLTRAKAKIQNFALLYGQGLKATAAKLGVTEDEAKEVRETVEKSAPFGSALDEFARRLAQRRGYLILLDGARVRFLEWEAGWLPREEWERARQEHWPMEPCSREEANQRKANPKHPWHNASLRRAGVRKALNRLIQGSAARQTKLAIRECARHGLIPILQMHDELDHDEDDTAKIDRVAQIMRDIVPLRLPMKVDTGYGHNWAAAKGKDKENALIPGTSYAGTNPTEKTARHRASRLDKLYEGHK